MEEGLHSKLKFFKHQKILLHQRVKGTDRSQGICPSQGEIITEQKCWAWVWEKNTEHFVGKVGCFFIISVIADIIMALAGLFKD